MPCLLLSSPRAAEHSNAICVLCPQLYACSSYFACCSADIWHAAPHERCMRSSTTAALAGDISSPRTLLS